MAIDKLRDGGELSVSNNGVNKTENGKSKTTSQEPVESIDVQDADATCDEDGSYTVCFTTATCENKPPNIACKTLIRIDKKGKLVINGLGDYKLYNQDGGMPLELIRAKFGDTKWEKDNPENINLMRQDLPDSVPVELKLNFYQDNISITNLSKLSFGIQYLTFSGRGNQDFIFRDISLINGM